MGSWLPQMPDPRKVGAPQKYFYVPTENHSEKSPKQKLNAAKREPQHIQ